MLVGLVVKLCYLSEGFNGFLVLSLLGQSLSFGEEDGEGPLRLVSVLRHLLPRFFDAQLPPVAKQQ